MEKDEDNSLVGSMLSSIEETALDSDPNADADAPRDVWWLRWLKFVSVIAVPAIVLGLGFLFTGFGDESSSIRLTEEEFSAAMKFNFWLGAGIGGGLGMIYVARCIVRKVDP